MAYLKQNKKVQFEWLGLADYQDTWDKQQALFDEMATIKVANRKRSEEEQQPVPNYLLFCEHPPTYTLGRNGHQNHLLINDDFLKKINARYYPINRGGDITYHGPGN